MPFALPAGPLRILCLAAHPDDVEIGCGGTLLELTASRMVTVTVVILSGADDRIGEAKGAARAFCNTEDVRNARFPDGQLPGHWGEVKRFLVETALYVQPDLIFSPRLDDSHQDHRLLAEIVSTVWRDSLVLRYEIPKWDGDLRPCTHYVPVSESRASKKFELLDEHYLSQRGRDWWDRETFLGLMRLRGIECRSRYAEGFEVGKAVINVSDRGSIDPR